MLLAKNDLEIEIADYLSNSKSDWSKALERYRIKYEDNVKGNFTGLIAEINLRLKLEDAKNKYKNRLILDPIENDSETDNYKFQKINGNFLIENKSNNRTHSEIDQLVLIDNLPVLFEIKTGHYKDGSKPEEINNHRKIQHYLKISTVKHLISPLEEYFGSKCGYVLLIPRNFIYPYSFLQQELTTNNGIISSMGFERKEFKDYISGLLNTYDFIKN